jgi:hypothetical protein
VAVNGIYASIIPSYKYNLVLKSFSYGTQVMGHPVHRLLTAKFKFLGRLEIWFIENRLYDGPPSI